MLLRVSSSLTPDRWRIGACESEHCERPRKSFQFFVNFEYLLLQGCGTIPDYHGDKLLPEPWKILKLDA